MKKKNRNFLFDCGLFKINWKFMNEYHNQKSHKLPRALNNAIELFFYKKLVGKFIRTIDIDSLPIFTHIEIETINRCNGVCSFCPVNSTTDQRPYTRMSTYLFKKIVTNLASLNYNGTICLFSNNEPFIDNRITEFCYYTRKTLPKARIVLYTNGSLLTINLLREIEKYVDLLVINDYETFDLSDLKEYYDKFLKENSKIFFSKRNYSEVRTSRGGKAPNKINASSINAACLYPFKQLVVRPDGKCSLCCNDALGLYTLGDLSNSSLQDIWYSKSYRVIRTKMIKSKRENLELCNSCDTANLIP